ncbi:MAG: hypothetical protein J7L90_03645 [Dehalococcoidia bacterium]|nr:hypothetical protein [Dehalococcoidia bacterium]
MKRFLLSGLVLLLFVVGCTPASGGESAEYTPDPDTWKVYTSDVFSYTLQHPSLWSVYDVKPEVVTFRSNKGNIFVVVKVYDILPGWSASELANKRINYIEEHQNDDETNYSNYSKEKGRWKGSWEVVYDFTSSEDEELCAREVAIPGSDYIYEVSGSWSQESGDEELSSSDIVNAMINSFRVIAR